MRITSAPAMTRSMWPTLVGENQLDVGRALDVGYIVGSARLTTRTVTANVRWACSIRWGRRRATQQMSGQTDRPTGATSVRPPARGPLRDRSRSFSPSPAVSMRDEWRGRSSSRDSRRHARCHFSPPIDWVTNERSSVSCHRWRVAVRGRVTGAASRCGGSITARPRRRSRTDRCHELTLHDAPGSDSDDPEGLRSNVSAYAPCRRGRVSAPPIARRQSRSVGVPPPRRYGR